MTNKSKNKKKMGAKQVFIVGLILSLILYVTTVIVCGLLQPLCLQNVTEPLVAEKAMIPKVQMDIGKLLGYSGIPVASLWLLFGLFL